MRVRLVCFEKDSFGFSSLIDIAIWPSMDPSDSQTRNEVDPTQRFSSRVTNYVKYRPGYPAGILDTLREECGLSCDTVIADVGSGTGILSELFLRNGNRVFGVEPNQEMREASERLLSGYVNFVNVEGRAEATTLVDRSVDLISAAQSFHWFDRQKARVEFSRILRPLGWVVLLWNERLTTTAFLRAYEQLLRTYSKDYEKVDHRCIDSDAFIGFFGSSSFSKKVYPNRQTFDLEGLEGRLLSSSYTPETGEPLHLPMLTELERIFTRHQVDGQVVFEYQTTMYYGRLRL
jgi:SAM-dependent methyltransferase